MSFECGREGKGRGVLPRQILGYAYGYRQGSTGTLECSLLSVTQFTKTVICQSHLCPLPLHVAPVYWTYDFTLRMYPLPDLIVCADKYDPFTSTQVECTVTNPVRVNYFLFGFSPSARSLCLLGNR